MYKSRKLLTLLVAIAFPLAAFANEPPRLIDGRIELNAEQSSGGKILRTKSENLIGVTLDKSCEKNFENKKRANIEWLLEKPLPAGWWHGVVESNFTQAYANRDISIEMVGGQNPSVRVSPNYIWVQKGEEQRFEFYVYTSEPSTAVRIDPMSDLWRWNRTWPVSKIILNQVHPNELDPSMPVTLDLPVSSDGSVPLPFPLPTGNWFLSGYMTKPGEAEVEGTEGLPILLSYNLDRWKKRRVYSSSFHLRSPLERVQILTKDLFSSVILRHKATREIDIDVEGELMTTTDPNIIVEESLVLHGNHLDAEAPTFPQFPQGKTKVVLTSWDDGKPTDLRCAEILIKHGYSPTFMLNGNSPALEFMDELEALGADIGSHGYYHKALHTLTPQGAFNNISEMRILLENQLGHPVIAFSFPNGYSPGQDEDGDYVLKSLNDAGYWIARTQLTRRQTIDDVDEPLLMRSNGLYGSGNKMLKADWPKFLVEEGGVFYIKGHSWQIGKSDAQWDKFEEFIAQFAGQPDSWYPSNTEFALWLWAQDNVEVSVESSSPQTTVVKLQRPWLDPWLSERCPISLNVPEGVTSVTWQGQEIPVNNGRVEIIWSEQTEAPL